MVNIVVDLTPHRDDHDLIETHLTAFNHGQRLQEKKTAGFSEFAVLLKDDDKQTVGGIWAQIYANWMMVELLYVPEAERGARLGEKLMHAAERQAKSLKLTGMWLTTYAFQALGFYQKLGFETFGEIEDFPPGSSCSFMRKYLVAQGGQSKE